MSLCISCFATSSDAVKAETLKLGDSKLQVETPKEWRVVKPANRLLEHELAIDPPEGIEASHARMTIMQAGGSIEANTARWVSQFENTEAGADRSSAKVNKLQIDGMSITTVEIAGTYLEAMRGPFGPKVPRDGYRLIGAIAETGVAGNYFFKLVGPDATVAPASDSFKKMLESLKKK